MSAHIESLEGRALFAVSVPITVLHAYDALLTDAVQLGKNAAAIRKEIAADQKILTADVRALGNTPASKALLRQVQVAGAKYITTLANATSRYFAAAKPAYRRMEVGASLFADAPSSATSKYLAASQVILNTTHSKRYPALLTAATNAPAAYAAALTALAAANPGATPLSADIASATNAQATLSTAENELVTKVATDVGTLANVV